MAGRGGPRPGAGRKPKRRDPVTLSPIRLAELKLAENLPRLVEVALALALEGDKPLLIYCIDRVLGRTIQPLSIENQIEDIAADFGVEPERVLSIVERLKSRKTA